MLFCSPHINPAIKCDVNIPCTFPSEGLCITRSVASLIESVANYYLQEDRHKGRNVFHWLIETPTSLFHSMTRVFLDVCLCTHALICTHICAKPPFGGFESASPQAQGQVLCWSEVSKRLVFVQINRRHCFMPHTGVFLLCGVALIMSKQVITHNQIRCLWNKSHEAIYCMRPLIAYYRNI